MYILHYLNLENVKSTSLQNRLGIYPIGVTRTQTQESSRHILPFLVTSYENYYAAGK
jgi:hypothetical protein